MKAAYWFADAAEAAIDRLLSVASKDDTDRAETYARIAKESVSELVRICEDKPMDGGHISVMYAGGLPTFAEVDDCCTYAELCDFVKGNATAESMEHADLRREVLFQAIRRDTDTDRKQVPGTSRNE